MILFIISTLVVLAGSTAAAIFHKALRKTWISICVCAALSAAGGTGCAILGFDPMGTNQKLYYAKSSTSRSTKKSVSKDQEGYIEMIRYLSDAGETDCVELLLSEYRDIADYSPEYMELVAEHYELTGESEKAKLLRTSLEGTVFELSDQADSAFDDRSENKDARLAALALWAGHSISDHDGEFIGADQTIDPMTALSTWLDQGAPYTDLPCMKKTLLAAELYMNSYDKIADSIMNDPDGDSLIVASQLIRKGTIKDSDVDGSAIRKKMVLDATEVRKYIKDQLSGKKSDKYSEDESKALGKAVKTLDNVISDDSNMLLKYTVDTMKENAEEESRTASKVYLELADIAFETGNTAAGTKYVEKSLSTASQSSDAEFASAVSKINGILKSSDDPEAKKKISTYVAQMTSNRMPEGVPDPSKLPDQNGSSGSVTGSPDSNYTEDSLNQCVSDSVNQLTGSVNIVSIDKSKFPNIALVAAVDDNIAANAEEFKKAFDLIDTDCEISNYTVEKVDYTSINVVLVCDDSGSMNGSKSASLREAVKKFIEKSGDDVNIGIVPFAGNVKENVVCRLGASKENLLKTAESMRGNGNTNIYAAVDYALPFYPDDPKALNIMIVMSDGQDGRPNDEKLNAIGQKCVNHGISIYTMGLGSASSADVLDAYSDTGGGSFYYVENADSIESFYNFIYNLGKNRYNITYEAIDTFKNDRFASLEHKDSTYIHCQKFYTLYNDDLDDAKGIDYDIKIGDITINGLKEKVIYPTKYSQEGTLTGSGFKKDDKVTVKLKGLDSHDCEVSYIDENSYKVTIPGGIPTGIYDVWVTYNQKRAVFVDGLIVSGGDAHTIRFGDYVFTATIMEESPNQVDLKGVVSLNGWLYFNGTVTLTGDREKGSTIQMSYKKANIPLTDESIGGLSGMMAKKGTQVTLPSVGSIKLFNDPGVSSTSDDYPVERKHVEEVIIPNLILVTKPSMALYPDRAVINFTDFSLIPDFVMKIIKSKNEDHKNNLLFALDAEIKCIYSKDRVDLDLEISYDRSLKKPSDYKVRKLGNITVPTSAGVEVKYKSKDNELSLKLGVDKTLFKIKENTKTVVQKEPDRSIAIEVAGKNGKLTKVEVLLAVKDITLPTEIPITLSKFRIGIEAKEGESIAKILDNTYKGQLDISVGKLSAVFPCLEKVFKDAALATFKDTYISIRLKEFQLKFGSKLEVLGFIQLGHIDGQIGEGLDYDNPLLTLQNDPSGFILSAGIGVKGDIQWVAVDLDGTLNLAITSEVIGLWAHGHCKVDVSIPILFWELSKTFSERGDFYIGGVKQYNGKFSFVITGRASSGGSNFYFSTGDNDRATMRSY